MPQIDLQSLSVFFRFGGFIAESTAFKDVRVTNRPVVFTRPHDLSRAQIVDGYVDLFKRAVAKLPDGIVLLSGGRDSRHIFLELVESGRKPAVCVTARHFPPKPDDDAEIAARLCERAGARYIIVPQGDRYSAEVEKDRLTGFSTLEHGWTICLRPHTRDQNVFDGLAGDALSQSGLQSKELLDLYRKDLDAFTERIVQYSGIDAIWPGLSRVSALEAVRKEAARYKDAVNPVSAFMFWNRAVRNVSTAPWGATRTMTPFLDPELFEFLCRIPPDIMLTKTLHDEVIARAYPSWNDIAYESKQSSARQKVRNHVRAYSRKALARCRHFRPLGLLARLAKTALTGDAGSTWVVDHAVYLDQLFAAAKDPDFQGVPQSPITPQLEAIYEHARNARDARLPA